MKRVRPIKETRPPASAEEDEEEGGGGGLVIVVNAQWRLAFDGVQWRVLQQRIAQKPPFKESWLTRAFFREFDEAIVFLARRRIYLTPGVFPPEAMKVLTERLDALFAEVRAAVAAFTKKKG